MQRFRFRLDSVLRWRETSAEVEQARLDLLLAERQKLAQQQAQLEQAIDGQRRTLHDVAFTSAERAAFDGWYKHATRVQKATAAAIFDCERRIERQRPVLAEARRKVELLRRLRERRHHEWSAEAARLEQAEVEEMVISRWKAN